MPLFRAARRMIGLATRPVVASASTTKGESIEAPRVVDPDDVCASDVRSETIAAPQTWHQAVLHWSLADNSPGWRSRCLRVLAVISLAGLVSIQIIALMAVIRAFDPYLRSCNDSTNCVTGLWCRALNKNGYCLPCDYPPAFCDETKLASPYLVGNLDELSNAPQEMVLQMDGTEYGDGVLGWKNAPSTNNATQDWQAFILPQVRTEMCSGCQKSITGYKALNVQQAGHVMAMRWWDLATTLMISIVVSLTVWSECGDVKVAMARLWKVDAPLLSESSLLRIMLSVIQMARLYLLVPINISAVPIFILTSGGDALNQCLNTVALLFILEIDDLAFGSLLSEGLKESLAAMPPISVRTGTPFAVRRIYTQVVMALAIWAPLWLYSGGWLSDGDSWAICLELVLFIWYVAAAIETSLVFLADKRVQWRHRWVAAMISLMLLLCSWLLVNTIIHALGGAVYEPPSDLKKATGSVPIFSNGAFLQPISYTLENSRRQDPEDRYWFFADPDGLRGLYNEMGQGTEEGEAGGNDLYPAE